MNTVTVRYRLTFFDEEYLQEYNKKGRVALSTLSPVYSRNQFLERTVARYFNPPGKGVLYLYYPGEKVARVYRYSVRICYQATSTEEI